MKFVGSWKGPVLGPVQRPEPALRWRFEWVGSGISGSSVSEIKADAFPSWVHDHSGHPPIGEGRSNRVSSEKYDARAGCMCAKGGQRSNRGPEKARGGQARRALRVRSPPDPEQHGPTWNTPACHSRLTGVDPDLDRAGCCGVEGRVRPMPEPQALQQPLRHILQRAEQLHRRSLALLAGQVP